MKKLILFLIFVPLFIQATEFALVAKPGKLLFKNVEIHLKSDSNLYDDCEYKLDLPAGVYKYINLHDTVLIVVDSVKAYALNECNIIKIIQ
jgi:hypothetical protein